jgi:hypothetical protein
MTDNALVMERSIEVDVKEQVESGFASTLSDGMTRIAQEMVAAERAIKRAREPANGATNRA